MTHKSQENTDFYWLIIKYTGGQPDEQLQGDIEKVWSTEALFLWSWGILTSLYVNSEAHQIPCLWNF
jgi:hypothetical protein